MIFSPSPSVGPATTAPGDPNTVWFAITAVASCLLLLLAAASAYFAWRAVRAATESLDTALVGVKAATDGVDVAVQGVLGAHSAMVKDHERRMADATMEALFRYLDQSRECWPVIREEAKAQSKTKKELLRTAKGTPARVAHQHLLQELEMIGTGCRLGVYSSRVVYDVARSTIRQMWDYSALYIADLREGEVDYRGEQRTAYEYFEWLLEEFDRLANKPLPEPPRGALGQPL